MSKTIKLCHAKLKSGRQCKNAVLGRKKYCYIHTKKPKKQDISSYESMKLYLATGRKTPRVNLDKHFKRLGRAYTKYGIDFLENAECEIILLRVLIADTLDDLRGISENEFGQRMTIREELRQLAKVTGDLMKRNADIKYGKNYSIKIEEVQKVVVTINQIIMKNVSSSDEIKKIASEMQKKLVVPMLERVK